MPLNEGLALSLALAESEIKRKQTESVLAELRQVYTEQQKTAIEKDEKIAELEKKITEIGGGQPSEAVN